MKKKVVNFIRNNRKKVLISCSFFVVLIGICLVIANTFAVLRPVKTVSISSTKTDYEAEEPGSWNIDKSAEWIAKGKARITFELDTIIKKNTDNTDIVLVLDRSGSMVGDKLAKVKADAISLVEAKLASGDNRFAIVNFDTDSELMLGLSNSKDEIIRNIDSLIAIGTTNYYKALVNADKALQGYVKDPNRELILLFLTDGYPNEDTPNEEGFYTYLKSQYPYLTVNGIQYEMGTEILDPIKKISDYQYIADMDNLNNVLFEAADTPIGYEDFTIVDYIDDTYFNLDSIDNIEVSIGDVKLEYEGSTPKVTWTMSNGVLKSGSSATMTIDVTLKSEYMGTEGMYPTNTKEEITSSIGDNPKEDITSPKTPVLSEAYEVIYDGNAPSDCTISAVPATKKYAAFDTVLIDQTKMTCGNYQFKGWEIITEGVKKVNDDYFIMPEEDVTLRATWSSLSISKSMNGEVSKVQTLYKIMADSAVDDNTASQYVASSSGIDFQYCPLDQSGRSTNGQGVYKLSSTANDTRPIYYFRGNVANNNVVYAGSCWKAVRTTETGGVKLLYNGPVGANGQCSNSVFSIGTSSFNTDNMSLSDAGYMYGNIYQNNILGYTYTFIDQMALSTQYYYGTDATPYNLGADGIWYQLSGENPISSTSLYPSLVGKYISQYQTSNGYYVDAPAYVVGVSGSTAYVIQVSNGAKYENYAFAIGNSITKNSNGTFTINNPKTVNGIEWYNGYAGYKGYYTCGTTATTCESPNYIIDTFVLGYDFIPVGNFVYGNSFTYANGQYTLTDTVSFYDFSSNKNQVTNHHYTCLNTSGKCSSVYYIYYTDTATTGSEAIYYISLSNGKSIEDARREMETNTQSSTIKTVIDAWYERNIKGTQYEGMLEDTVYCNSRDDNQYGTDPAYIYHGLLPNLGNIEYPLYFSSYGRAFIGSGPQLTCSNVNDAFTVSSSIGNGALTYPIAMLTIDETDLAGRCQGTYIDVNSNTPYWILASLKLEGLSVYGTAVGNGYTWASPTSNPAYVRPVVSIKPGIRVGGGDGTLANPYILEVD